MNINEKTDKIKEWREITNTEEKWENLSWKMKEGEKEWETKNDLTLNSKTSNAELQKWITDLKNDKTKLLEWETELNKYWATWMIDRSKKIDTTELR
jgi:peptidoglycan hydrolase CwlO-like protein